MRLVTFSLPFPSNPFGLCLSFFFSQSEFKCIHLSLPHKQVASCSFCLLPTFVVYLTYSDKDRNYRIIVTLGVQQLITGENGAKIWSAPTPLWLNTLSFSHSLVASATLSPSRLPTSDLSTPTAPMKRKQRERKSRGVEGRGVGESLEEGGRRDWFIGAEERDQGRMRGRGRVVEWSRKCVKEKGEERRVKVVIDGRPGLRPLPYSGQGACFCRPSPPSIPVFTSPSNSPTRCYCIVSVASFMPFIHPFSSSLAVLSILSAPWLSFVPAAFHPLKNLYVTHTQQFKMVFGDNTMTTFNTN